MVQLPSTSTLFPYTTLFRSSGSRNPLSFLWNYELVREYFHRHPLPERGRGFFDVPVWRFPGRRSEEHTSELQSLRQLVWRLLLEKKKAMADRVRRREH